MAASALALALGSLLVTSLRNGSGCDIESVNILGVHGLSLLHSCNVQNPDAYVH
jgi:hypothetical protein